MRWLTVLATLLVLAAPLAAGTVSLAWDHSVTGGVTGYKVYFGFASRTYGTPITIGYQNTCTVQDLPAGRAIYFAVTAFDGAGNESDFSNEVSTTLPVIPAPPGNLKVVTTTAK